MENHLLLVIVVMVLLFEAVRCMICQLAGNDTSTGLAKMEEQ